MDFYYVNYVYEFFRFDEFYDDGDWYPISSNKIIVIASDLEDATNKINKCFSVYNNKRLQDHRYRLIGEIKKVHGLGIDCDFKKNTIQTIDEKV